MTNGAAIRDNAEAISDAMGGVDCYYTEDIMDYYIFYNKGDLCAGSRCSFNTYKALSDNCMCQSGTCLQYGYCEFIDYSQDYYNSCYHQTYWAPNYYDGGSADLIWLWWVLGVLSCLSLIAIPIIIICCCVKKKKMERELAYYRNTQGAAVTGPLQQETEQTPPSPPQQQEVDDVNPLTESINQ